jgi:hypothetical protein
MNVSEALPLLLLEVDVMSRLVRGDLRMLVKRIIDTQLQRSSGVQGRECRAIKGVRKKICNQSLGEQKYPSISYPVVKQRLICFITHTRRFYYFPAMFRCILDKLV